MAYLPLLAALLVLMCVPTGVAQNRFFDKGGTTFQYPQTDQETVPFSSQLSPNDLGQTLFRGTSSPYPHFKHMDAPVVTQFSTHMPFPGQQMSSQDLLRQMPFPGQPMPPQDHFRRTPFPGQPMPSQHQFRQTPLPGYHNGVNNDDSHVLFHEHPSPPEKSFFDEFVGVVEILLGLLGSAYNFTSGDPIQQILGTVDFYEEIKDL